jgi:hypothetical protein
MASGPNPLLTKFRGLLSEFKRPYIEKTNAAGPGEHQDLAHLDKVFQNIDQLYFLLKPIVDAGGVVPQGAEKGPASAVIAVFEREGIFPSLRADPSLKEDMQRLLTLDLHTYPYTISTRHINALASGAVESHQGELVPNTEQS